jgi:hypothetical protein
MLETPRAKRMVPFFLRHHHLQLAGPIRLPEPPRRSHCGISISTGAQQTLMPSYHINSHLARGTFPYPFRGGDINAESHQRLPCPFFTAGHDPAVCCIVLRMKACGSRKIGS